MKKLHQILVMAVFFLATQLPLWAGGGCYGGHGGGSTGKVAILLVTLALGYGVLVLSQSQTKPINTLGRIVGGIILIVSLLGLVCSAMCGMGRLCGKKGMCSYGSKMSCPMTGASTGAQSEPEEMKK